jgi:hypothetical protein
VSRVVNQEFHTIRLGQSSVGVSVVKLDNSADTIKLPNMAAGENCAVQLRRSGDARILVTQDDTDDVSLDGGVAGNEVLIISLHREL